MSKKILSIVIPIYNPNLGHFADCMASIKSQYTDEMEVILVDDCSTDKRYLQFIAGFPCQIVVNHENLRQGLSRQVGLDMCKGEYVTFIDQDDIFTEGSLSYMIKALKTSKCKFLYQTRTSIEGSNMGPGYARYCDEMLHGNFFNVKTLKKYDVRFDPEFSESAEDTQFMSIVGMLLSQKDDGNNFCIQDPLVTYVWFLWDDSTSHKEGTSFPYFVRTYEKFTNCHKRTMTWFREHFNNDDYIYARTMHLLMVMYFNCMANPQDIVWEKSFDLVDWLLDFNGITIDDAYEELQKTQYYYSENYMKHIERNGPFMPEMTVKEYFEKWKEEYDG